MRFVMFALAILMTTTALAAPTVTSGACDDLQIFVSACHDLLQQREFTVADKGLSLA